MKIVIMGVGAMGSVYAALLADAGHEVHAIDLWQEHVDAIRKQGLRVEGASGDRTVTSIHAATEVDATPEVDTTPGADAASEAGAASGTSKADLYIIATKAAGVGAAARTIRPLMGPASLVLTIQNGLGAGERIAEHMPVDNVLLGVAEGFGASMRGPGHAHHNGMNLIRIGEIGGGLTERAERIATVWREAGFRVRAFEDINQLIWEKFLCNGTFSAPCTAFDCTIGELMAAPDRWRVALGCAQEIYALGQARAIAFSFDDPIAYVTAFGERMPHARPSMLLDHHARRVSEIDAINGMASTLGRELGIETPYNEALTAVVKAREASFAKPAG